MGIKTKLTELCGIEIPVIQGGMHYVGYAEMAAAVSNAGGLGIITALTQKSPEDLRAEIQKCKKLTSKPFGVNLTLLPMLAPPNYDEYVQVIVDEGIKVVETAGRAPDQFIKLFKANDIVVIHKCVAVKHALSAQKLGVDMISLDGADCGGHPGEINSPPGRGVGNWVLAPRGAEQLTIPFVVSGGVGNGLQLAAALALGAEGVNCGTLFMATKEAPIHENIKKALVNGDEYDTTLIFTSLNNTERVFKNSASTKVVEIEKEQPGDFSAIKDYVMGENYRRSFQETGNADDSCWSCGQSLALVHDIPSCEELLKRMVDDAERSIKSMSQRLVSKM
ncbi:NADH:quinone reductase [Durusdinium trenchii]|uniref:NADH:quinone reductase n=1 Tax=Durusdinium trenchii TaxID=1381693 RepID=A0ABP0I6Z4_9DINO